MLVSHYALHYPRLGFRITALIFGIIALSMNIAIGVRCMNSWTRFLEVTGESGFVPAGCWGLWQMPFLGISLLWNIAEFITLCVNGKRIHPGAHVALDFIAYAGLKAAGVYDAWAGGGNGFHLLEATSAFEILTSLCHLALFVMACVAVHKWRKNRTQGNLQPKANYVQVHQQNGTPHQYPLVQQHASLPPLPPGMVYVVPIPNGEQPGFPPVTQGSQQLVAGSPDAELKVKQQTG